MQWLFWKREKSQNGSPDPDAKLPRPRDLPQQIGGYLVVNEKLDPDWVWGLKCVMRRCSENQSECDFRVFNPIQTQQAEIKVVNFKSLDNHPELILYQGKYNKHQRYAQFGTSPTEDRAA